MSQEPADPTASSAPSDGTPPTIPSPAADVQPDAGGSVPPTADAATPPAEVDAPPAAVETVAAPAEVVDGPVEAGPPTAEPIAADEARADATSSAILAAVVAEPEQPASTPEAALPKAQHPDEPAAEPAVVSAVAPGAPRRRGPWRTIGGVVLLLLLAAAAGFGASFLVPGFVDVAVPSGAAAGTTSGPSPTAARTATPSPSPRPSRSPTPSPSSGGSATPRASSTIYVVKQGDILSAIAARFGVTVQAIVAANGLTDPNHIEPGQRLIIPAP